MKKRKKQKMSPSSLIAIVISTISLMIGVYAANQIPSGQVIYSGSKTVSTALDELYEQSSTYSDNFKKEMWPVGSIFISTKNTNPSTFIGGTWAAFGTGRTLVGINTSDSDFNTVEKTGGEKKHTLTTTEIPAHNHTAGKYDGYSIGNYGFAAGNVSNVQGITVNMSSTAASSRIATNNTGGGQGHNNLQPYITVYMWKRTA